MLQHWPQRVANWLPKFNVILFFFFLFSFFQPWGQYIALKVQHLLVTWGQIEIFVFSISTLTPSQCKALWADFNFCTNRIASFELNLGLESQCKVCLGFTFCISVCVQASFNKCLKTCVPFYQRKLEDMLKAEIFPRHFKKCKKAFLCEPFIF